MKPKTKIPRTLQQNKNLNKIIKDLQKRMEETINIQNKRIPTTKESSKKKLWRNNGHNRRGQGKKETKNHGSQFHYPESWEAAKSNDNQFQTSRRGETTQRPTTPHLHHHSSCRNSQLSTVKVITVPVPITIRSTFEPPFDTTFEQ